MSCTISPEHSLARCLWRAGWGDLRVCRFSWSRFASLAVGPATSSGDEWQVSY